MDKKVAKHPQCNHKDKQCSNMEKQKGSSYGVCLLRNPFDCPFEPKPDRLLTDEERKEHFYTKGRDGYQYDIKSMLKAQDAKTASIIGKELSALVEEAVEISDWNFVREAISKLSRKE